MKIQVTNGRTKKGSTTTDGDQRRRRIGGRENHKQKKNIQKGCTAEEDIWESKENLKNAMELVEGIQQR